ncbi:MAG: fused response regulator/phosphatase [Gammaproteobacteria bacterium]|jgi:CheY-like chemotaxis protein|nr:fused response regulator/phosphatase [Gammaproteobacteria bacterium]MBD3775820.1 fused response regulator/phosphatase [Thiotrichales bacterium]
MTHPKPYVLAVDDEPINRFVLEDLLEDQFELLLLESGQACLDAVARRKPDLILLDINMPGMDGFEVCQRLQTMASTRDIPIMFLTAMSEVADEKRGLEMGAVDYITKPFTEALLLARMRTHLSLSRSHRLLTHQNALLNKERNYIENVILNMRDDAYFVSENLRVLMAPLSTTNGDLVLSAQTPCGKRYLLIGDFTGHGLAAALGGPLVSALFYLLAEQGATMETILLRLNQELYRKMPADIFMATVLVEWQPARAQLRIWNCGMADALYFKKHRLEARIPSSSFALGVVSLDGMLPPVVEMDIDAGSDLFVYSDGLIEALSPLKERFGQQRIQSEFEALLATQSPLENLYESVQAFSGEFGLKDDVTLVHLQL